MGGVKWVECERLPLSPEPRTPPALQTLVVRGCDMVTDVGMDWLASGCHDLRKLDVTGCHRLTDTGLHAIRYSGISDKR